MDLVSNFTVSEGLGKYSSNIPLHVQRLSLCLEVRTFPFLPYKQDTALQLLS